MTIDSGATGAEILRFVESLSQATTLPELSDRFSREVQPLFGIAVALHVIEPWTGREIVPDPRIRLGFAAFLARYERYGREVDVLHEHVLATDRPAYTLDLMEMEEWLEHPLYLRVKRMYDIRHEIQAPVLTRDGLVGTVYISRPGPGRGFTPTEVELAGAVGRTVGAVVERIHHTNRLERDGELLRAALAVAGTAVITVNPASPEPIINPAAQSLLAEVAEGEALVHRLLAPSNTDIGRSRCLDVHLVDGTPGVLRTRRNGAGTVVVLELQREGHEVDERTLRALTPREREVALLVVDGSSDREIAERLYLSPHTVRQHVKRIYRKVDVDSRVALTRMLLGANPVYNRSANDA